MDMKMGLCFPSDFDTAQGNKKVKKDQSRKSSRRRGNRKKFTMQSPRVEQQSRLNSDMNLNCVSESDYDESDDYDTANRYYFATNDWQQEGKNIETDKKNNQNQEEDDDYKIFMQAKMEL